MILLACLSFFTCVCVCVSLSDSGKETETLADDQEELKGKSQTVAIADNVIIVSKHLPKQFYNCCQSVKWRVLHQSHTLSCAGCTESRCLSLFGKSTSECLNYNCFLHVKLGKIS